MKLVVIERKAEDVVALAIEHPEGRLERISELSLLPPHVALLRRIALCANACEGLSDEEIRTTMAASSGTLVERFVAWGIFWSASTHVARRFLARAREELRLRR